VGIQAIFPQTLFTIGDVPIKDTVLQTWILVAILGGLAFWTRNRYRVWDPKSWQLVVETLINYVEDLIVDIGGRPMPDLVPYLTTMLGFITIANLLGLLPVFQAPTRDLNTTIALALVSLGSSYALAIRSRGVVGWLKSFIEPVAFILPLNLLGHISRVASMSLRLFGNVVAGEIIGGVMFMLLPVLAPLPMNLLMSITGVLQALVFTVLTLVFMIDAMGEEEEASTRN
jgi:F-type H+-transporting ATPase subunit a